MLTTGLFLAGPGVDFIRTVIGGKNRYYSWLMYVETTIYFAHEKYVFSAYRMIFLVGFIISFIGFLTICFCFKDVDVEEQEDNA